MGNALWAGVRLKDVLDRAGVNFQDTILDCGLEDEPIPRYAGSWPTNEVPSHA
jgi:hypothetical protein